MQQISLWPAKPRTLTIWHFANVGRPPPETRRKMGHIANAVGTCTFPIGFCSRLALVCLGTGLLLHAPQRVVCTRLPCRQGRPQSLPRVLCAEGARGRVVVCGRPCPAHAGCRMALALPRLRVVLLPGVPPLSLPVLPWNLSSQPVLPPCCGLNCVPRETR